VKKRAKNSSLRNCDSTSALPRKDRGVSVLGVGGLRGKGDASQVEPLAPLEKSLDSF